MNLYKNNEKKDKLISLIHFSFIKYEYLMFKIAVKLFLLITRISALFTICLTDWDYDHNKK